MLHRNRPGRSRRAWSPVVILMSLPPALHAGSAGAQEGVAAPEGLVARVTAEPSAFLDRRVSLTGSVVRQLHDDGDGTSEYHLEEGTGQQLRVVTVDPPPAVGSRWVVTGVVVLDPGGVPYLVESSRVEGGLAGAPGSVRTGGGTSSALPSFLAWAALGLAVLALPLLIRWSHARRASRSRPHLIFTPPRGSRRGPARREEPADRPPEGSARPDTVDGGRPGATGEGGTRPGRDAVGGADREAGPTARRSAGRGV